MRAYTTISQIMIDAAAADEQHAPAWWHARDRRPRAPHLGRRGHHRPARPAVPLPRRAVRERWRRRGGRGCGGTTPSPPRRATTGCSPSMCKAVPAGWVSNALVNRARPGDVIRLGPPAGSMVVDHTTDNGLLCLGGGTGIAPIKALVEDVAEHGGSRRRSRSSTAPGTPTTSTTSTPCCGCSGPLLAVGAHGRLRHTAGRADRAAARRRTGVRAVGGVRRVSVGAARHDPQRRGHAGADRDAVAPDTPRPDAGTRPDGARTAAEALPRAAATRQPRSEPSRPEHALDVRVQVVPQRQRHDVDRGDAHPAERHAHHLVLAAGLVDLGAVPQGRGPSTPAGRRRSAAPSRRASRRPRCARRCRRKRGPRR